MAFDLSRGVIAAPVTPFNPDESVDWSTLDRYMADIAAGGPVGIAMNMAASEGGSLTIDEQLEVIRSARRYRGRRLLRRDLRRRRPSTTKAAELGKRLVDAGADALVVFPPLPTFISKPLPVDVVVDFHKAIADAAGVPVIAFHTPFVDYPQRHHQGIRDDSVSIVALKDAAFNVDRTIELVEEAEGTPIKILTGNDTFILEAMLMGCTGALIGFAGTATAEDRARCTTSPPPERSPRPIRSGMPRPPGAAIAGARPLRDYRVRMKYALVRQGVIPTRPPACRSRRSVQRTRPISTAASTASASTRRSICRPAAASAHSRAAE
jgi:4-hydroxy-tetrahydrodipicolinate synthase